MKNSHKLFLLLSLSVLSSRSAMAVKTWYDGYGNVIDRAQLTKNEEVPSSAYQQDQISRLEKSIVYLGFFIDKLEKKVERFKIPPEVLEDDRDDSEEREANEKLEKWKKVLDKTFEKLRIQRLPRKEVTLQDQINGRGNRPGFPFPNEILLKIVSFSSYPDDADCDRLISSMKEAIRISLTCSHALRLY